MKNYLIKLIGFLKSPELKIYLLSVIISNMFYEPLGPFDLLYLGIFLFTYFILWGLRNILILKQRDKYNISIDVELNYYELRYFDVKFERHFFGLKKVEKELLQELSDIKNRTSVDSLITVEEYEEKVKNIIKKYKRKIILKKVA